MIAMAPSSCEELDKVFRHNREQQRRWEYGEGLPERLEEERVKRGESAC